MATFETFGFGQKFAVFLIIFHLMIIICGIFIYKTDKIKKEKKKKIIKIFLISYIGAGLIISPFAVMYFFTHTPVSDIVPPTLIIKLLDKSGNPVENADCVADIQTEKGYTEDKQFEEIEILRELECYGREKCSREGYIGYYKLKVTETTYEEFNFLFFRFWRFNETIKGDFEIKVVCRTPLSVAYFIFNNTNFPCSPIPLEGNYIAPSFYCSDKDKLIDKHAYELEDSEFDEYDLIAIDFLKENYQDKTILANNKLEIAMDDCNPYEAYSCGLKPVGIIQDKKGYGDPYVFNEFMVSDCNRRLELINEFNIDVVLSRFELEKCEFMREIYNNTDFIYEVIR